MPFAGQKIPLSMQLHDGAGDKYVHAVIRDQDGVDFTASPVPLAHVGSGRYTSDAIAMAAGVVYLDVTYEVFDDAGYSLPSADHFLGTDVFTLEVPDQTLLDKLNEIIARLEGTLGSLTSVVGVIEGDELKAIIEDLKDISGDMSDLEVTAVIENQGVSGVIEAQEIIGAITCKE